MTLNHAQRDRYARQIVLPEIGTRGQEKLLLSRVLVVGAGGLGSPACFYLAAAGIGTIGLVDSDAVEVSNLQRQILHGTGDIGRPKVDSAIDAIRDLNSNISVEPHHLRLTSQNASGLAGRYDFIIDATDSFESKFLVADACHFSHKPYVHAAVTRFEGQMITVVPEETACYRCVFQEPPPDGVIPPPAKSGVIGVLPGVMGTLAAGEAIKYLLGIGRLLTNRLLVHDGLAMTFRNVRVNRNPDCPLCGTNATIKKP